MTKKALKSFEQRVWEELINPCATGTWIDDMIAESKKQPSAPFADSGPTPAMLNAGISREEIGRLVRHMSYEAASSFVYMLDEEGLLTRRGAGMHENLLDGDPSGMEGGTGSWPVRPQSSPQSNVGPLKIPKATKVEFSPDCRTLLVSRTTFTSGFLQLWDCSKREMTDEFKSLPNLRDVAWSPDSKRIAAGSHRGVVCVHDAHTGKMIWKSKPTERENRSVTFSFDGKRVISSGFEQYVRIFDAGNGKPIDPIDLGTDARVVRIAASPVEDLLAATTGTMVVLLNTQRREEVGRSDCSSARAIDRLQFLADGRHLLSVAYNELGIWDIKSGKLVNRFEVSKAQAAAVSSDSALIAVSEREGPVKLLDRETGQVIGEAESDGAFRWSLSFSADRRYLAIGAFTLGYVYELSAILKPPTQT